MIASTKRNGPATGTVERATHVHWENPTAWNTLSTNLCQQCLGLMLPGHLASLISPVASVFPKPLSFTPSACKGQGRQPLPKPPLQSHLSRGMEQRWGGVSGNYRVLKNRSLMSQRKDECLQCHVIPFTASVCGADPSDTAWRGQWSQGGQHKLPLVVLRVPTAS